MSDAAIFLTMILIILTFSLLSIHSKLDELDDDLKSFPLTYTIKLKI
jgi:hypothetical protein